MDHMLMDTAKRLQAVIDTAIDGIVTINAKGIIESINPAGAEMFGYTQEELVGQNISVLMPEPHNKAHNSYLESYLRTKEPRIIGIGRELEGLEKDGNVFPIRLAVSEVQLENSMIFTGIIHDMTQVKEAEAKVTRLNKQLERKVEERTHELERVINRLLRTNRQLEVEVSKRALITAELKKREEELSVALAKEMELSELKSRFVSMASHEFRTPLSTILSSASLIKRYELAEQQSNREKHVGRIKSAVSNLTAILNDFLSVSKLDEGRINVKIETVDIEALCRETIDEIEGMLKENQTINFHKTANIEHFHSDYRILKNVLFNMLSNAIKYSPEGSEINFELMNKSDWIIVRIKDNGIGIPEHEQKHLFKRFFRASNSSNIQGTGLGLNIVKQYIELLHGNISFVSKLDKGSNFIIELPNLESK